MEMPVEHEDLQPAARGSTAGQQRDGQLLKPEEVTAVTRTCQDDDADVETQTSGFGGERA
jgi:hypothetical protein